MVIGQQSSPLRSCHQGNSLEMNLDKLGNHAMESRPRLIHTLPEIRNVEEIVYLNIKGCLDEKYVVPDDAWEGFQMVVELSDEAKIEFLKEKKEE